jgi:predicted ribonuclease YlaK
VRRVVAAFPTPGPQVRLYFDGSEAATESPSPNVQVIYPGGDGEQRADRAILKCVAELAGQGGTTPVVVVTRDIDLARRAGKRGASVVAPGDFLLEWKLDLP